MSDWAFDKQALDRYLTKSDEDDSDLTYKQIVTALNWNKHRGKTDWVYNTDLRGMEGGFTAIGGHELTTLEGLLVAQYYRDNPEPDEERGYYDY